MLFVIEAMYLKRRIDKQLDEWLRNDATTPALVVGIRQCGKTETVREFARRHNLDLFELNFWSNSELCSDFDGSLEVDDLVSNISLRFPGRTVSREKALFFFDEIQDCPRARLAFKNFKNDGRYKVVGSGSYLGINGYVIGDTTPAPTGCENVFHMKTMDFEEFLWAVGYSEEQVDTLCGYFERKEPVPVSNHNLYRSLFLKYACIGGFPRVVRKYLETRRIVDAFQLMSSIVFDMKSDFGRRRDKNGNPVFNAQEVARIQSVYDLIPTFLAKENKRFIVSKVSGGYYARNDAIEYLREAHIVSKVHNVAVPSLPLAGERIESQFKLFPEDIGIVTSMYGIDTVAAMNRGELGQGKGALYEAIVFDSLNKAGIDTYYFAKESGLEVDFVVSYEGIATLIEAKARTGNAKSSRTIMNHPEHYGKTRLIKIGDYNISEEGDVITIPHYLTFVLGKSCYDF